jgi:hypothetical protein
MGSRLEIVIATMTQGQESWKDTENACDSLKSKVGTESSGMAGAFSKLGPIIAVAAAVALAGVKSLNEGMDFGSKIQDTAERLNLSTKAVQEWNYAGTQSGASSEAIYASFGKLTQNIYDASTGNEKLAGTFKALNITLTDNHGNLKDTTTLTNETMNALADIKNPTEQAAIAQDLLGKGCKELIPLLAGGSVEMNKVKDNASKMGMVLSDEATKALDSAGDSMAAMQLSMKVANAEMISNLMPAIQSFTSIVIGGMSAVTDLAEGIRLLTQGKTELTKKMEDNDAINEEIIGFVDLRKEYQDTIKCQEALKKSGGSLFSQEVYDNALLGIESVNAAIKNIKAGPEVVADGTSVAAEKAKQDALAKTKKEARDKNEKETKEASKRLQAAFQADQKKQDDDLELAFKNEQKKKKETEASDAALTKDKFNRAKKLDSDLDKLAISGEKDADKRAKLQSKQEIRDAKKQYDDLLKLKNVSADEIEKAEQVKNESIKQSQDAYDTYHAASEQAKADSERQGRRETLDSTTSMLQEMASQSKAAAIAYKTLAIATTIIDTYSGAQKAFNSLASIPYVGFALGVAASAVSVVSGLARVNQIKNQTFASGGTSVEAQFAWVGEQGRELVKLNKGDEVYSHQKSTQMVNNNNQKSNATIQYYSQNADKSYSKKIEREIRSGKSENLIRKITKEITKRSKAV